MSDDRNPEGADRDGGSPGPADEPSAADPALDEERTANDRNRGSGSAGDRTADDGRQSGGRGLSDRAAFLVSTLFALALAFGAVLLVGVSAPFFEELSRVRPTIEGGGIGTDWIFGNTRPLLDFMIAFVHAADVIMGVFILVMVFLHWAAFRRLAARMQPPRGTRRERDTTAATDGGSRE